MHEGGVYEVYAVVQPDNARAAATARRMGMEWVRETGRYGGIKLQVYRVRHGDLAYRDTRSGEPAPPADPVLRAARGEAPSRAPAREPRSEP